MALATTNKARVCANASVWFAALLFLGVAGKLAAAPVAAAAERHGANVYTQAGHWIDDQNQEVTLSQWTGKSTVLTMAYGACRKICSTTLRRLEEIQALADRHGLALEFIVISFDPKSDTPEAWADYRRSRHLERTNWHFLSGSATQTKRIGDFLGIKYWVYDDHVLHDFKVALVGPQGEIGRELDWRNQDNLVSFLGLPSER